MSQNRKEPPRGATLSAPPREPVGPRIREALAFRFELPAWVWWSLLCIGLLVAVIVGGNKAYEEWPVEEIVVVGSLEAIDPREIGKSLLWVKQESFFSLDVSKVQQQVVQMPLVGRVAVRKRWPGSVELLIYEDVPVALWNDEYLMTASGRVSALPAEYDAAGLMHLYGAEQSRENAVKVFRRAQQVLVNSGVKVASLNINAIRTVDMTLSNGWSVRFGKQYFEERLQRLVVLLDKLDTEAVRQVDLRYGKGAAIRWNNTGVTG